MLRIGLIGATGRMAPSIINYIIANPHTSLNFALVRSSNLHIGKDLGKYYNIDIKDILFSDDQELMWQKVDAIIDMSAPETSLELAKNCAKHHKIHILGTTGLDNNQQQQLKIYAKDCRIVFSFNMSLGMNILLGLVKQTAAILNDDFDIEIVEMHHRYKKDSPSGAALMLGKAAAEGRKIQLDDHSVFARHGIIGERKKGEIGFASLRGGDMIFDHTVIFAGDKERVELTHKSTSRDIYAKGAVRACLWAKDQANGLYSMQDVLFKK